MLNKDLIKFRRLKDRLKPSFIDVGDWRMLKLSEQLLAIYNNGIGMTRSEIDEQVTMIVNAQRDLKLAKGLNKLCQDRTDFGKGHEVDYPVQRKKLFLASAEVLKEAKFEDYHDFQMEVYRRTKDLGDFTQGEFYNDLPQNETLVKFKAVNSRQLLERYNSSLVQSLLLYAGEINLDIQDADSQKLRRLFKYLKFFRLLADIRCTKFKGRGKNKEPAAIRMKIDGPVSLFENTSKYGLQLASFFPAIPDLMKWQLTSEIKLNNKRYTLKIDQKAGLVSHYRNFTSYVPDEIKVFHQQFRDKQEEWQIVGNTPFIHSAEGELVFPDLSFQNEAGDVYHLELFHRWHMAPLLRRLDQCEDPAFDRLIIGVDRGLISKGGLKETLEGSPWFAEKGFLFRDFPGVSTLTRKLQALTKTKK